MEDDYWNTLERDIEHEFIPGYDEPMMEEDWDEEEEREFDEFAEEPEFGFSYGQLEQIGFGDPEIGMTITGATGRMARLEKMIQAQTVSQEKLYLVKLKAELSNHLSSPLAVNNYASQVQKVPRYWLKNVPTMAYVIYMISRGDKLDSRSLKRYSEKSGIHEVDLLRYHRLLKNYIK